MLFFVKSVKDTEPVCSISVFLLLIFFIVISTLITAGVNVNVPKSGGDPSDKKILKINVTDENEYDVNWYHRIVEYEIKPLLSEYWFDDNENWMI